MSLLQQLEERSKNLRSILQQYQTNNFPTKGTFRREVISISDLHIPYQRTDLIEEIVKRHAGADTLVINGDMFDAEAISSFYKHKEVPLIHEYLIAQDLLELFSDKFGKVILIDGNHDAGRYTRQLEKLPPPIRFLFRESLMQHLAIGEKYNSKGERTETVPYSNVYYAVNATSGSTGWWHREGQAIFCHRLRGFKKNPMANAVHMAQWFRGRGTTFQCLVSGHTHGFGSVIWEQKLVIDQGCLCLPMEYEANGSANLSPQVLGYAKISLDRDGHIDVQETCSVLFGTYAYS